MTIYVRNKPLYIVEKLDGKIDEYLHRPETIFIDELNGAAVRTMLHELEKDEYYRGVLLYKSRESALEEFKKELTLIQAAGGIVFTKEGEVLMIFRRGKWDLPKGKLDEGEDLATCAIREIREETGIHGIKLLSPLHVTYHTYYENEQHILKESHWFLVEADQKEHLVPQTDEDIEECAWVPESEISTLKSNMHASIIDVVDVYLANKSL
jgi:8-oxo-dGTP pyrophosphatase MutT (NUDIX family)